MPITQSIKQAQSRGATPEQIIGEIQKQNPQKAGVFQEAQKRGANAQQILDEVLKQNLQVGEADPFQPGRLAAPEVQNRAFTSSQAKALEQQDQKKADRFSTTGETLKGVGSVIANSQIGLGKSLGKIYGDQGTSEAQSLANLSSSQAMLLQRIREKQAKGEDVTRLAQVFNENQKVSGGIQQNFEQSNAMPTTGEVVGQLGGTALDILTAGTYGAGMKTGKLATSKAVQSLAAGAGVPELGKIASQKASGVFTSQGAKNIAKGAGFGYAADVTQGLQGARGEDRTGASAFIPGLGTAIGATIPAISETSQSVKNRFDPEVQAQKLVEKRATELNKLDRLQTLRKTVDKGTERGIDIKKVLSETDVLHGSVDKTGKITTRGTDGAIDQYRKLYVDGNEKIVSEALAKEGKSISPATVRVKLKQAILNSGMEGAELVRAERKIENELAGYARRSGVHDTIPLGTLHSAKVDKYSNINFMTDASKAKYEKTVAKALKELVETHSDSIDVRAVNRDLSKHFAVLDYLEKLDGKIVEGGKLGKYFAQTVGAIVGSHFGPVGSVVGAEVGGRLKGSMMSRAFNGKTGKIAPQADAVTDAMKYRDSAPLQLPQSSNSFGRRNQSQSATIMNPSTGISNSIPQESYFGQGKRELTELGSKAKAFAKKPKIGMSLESIGTSPEKIARRVDANDVRIIKKFLKGDLSSSIDIQPILKEIGIANDEQLLVKRFLQEVVDIAGEGFTVTPIKKLGKHRR